MRGRLTPEQLPELAVKSFPPIDPKCHYNWLHHPGRPQNMVRERNANYEQIVRQLAFKRKPWFAAERGGGGVGGEEGEDELDAGAITRRRLGAAAEPGDGACGWARGRGRLGAFAAATADAAAGPCLGGIMQPLLTPLCPATCRGAVRRGV